MSINSIKEWWHRALIRIGKIVGPGYSCYVCGRDLENIEYPICNNCKIDMEKIGTSVCLKCGAPVNGDSHYCSECYGKNRDFDMARASYVYNPACSKIVADLKYNKKKYISKFMAEEMYARLIDFDTMPDIIVPVPITKKRYNKRGFNQSELIAEELEKLIGADVVRKDLVFRGVDRLPQAGLSKAERLINLKGAFSVDKTKNIKGKTVLVVDDVFTTGSTVGEVIRLLRELKPKSVYVLTFAKTIEN